MNAASERRRGLVLALVIAVLATWHDRASGYTESYYAEER